MRLEGRVALITGAGSGIGEATARRFAREGATVVVNDVDVEPARSVVTELQRGGARALSVAADVTRRADVEAMVDARRRRVRPLDVLVNNAGINRDAMSHKMTEEQWDQVLTVNLKGTFLCAQAALAADAGARLGARDQHFVDRARSATSARPTTPPRRRGSSASRARSRSSTRSSG